MRSARRSRRWWRRAVAVVTALVIVGAGTVAAGRSATEQPASAWAAGPAPEELIADTEADAREKAVKAGRRVEVAAFRSERREVYANPDGTMTAIEHTQPVRTYRDGGWVKLDPTLRWRADGSVAPASTTVDLVFSGGGDAPLATITKAGRSVSLDWDGRLPTPVLDGSSATYRNVFPGVDLVVNALVDGFSHVLVVKDGKAAANPAVARINLPVTANGAALRATEAGGVEIIDAGSGGVMLAADAPTMWDSSRTSSGGPAPSATSKGARRAEVRVAAGSRSLTLTPDPELLRGSDTVYPVYIDPVYRDEYRSAWAMVDSGYPYEEYWKFDGSRDEGLGRCPYWTGECNNSEIRRLFYQVSSSFYEGKSIISAHFAATLRFNYYGKNVAHYADLHLMNKRIYSSTNWNNKPSGTKIATANTPAPSDGSCSLTAEHGTEWSVTPEVRDAAADGTNVLTFGLRNANETDGTHWMRFCRNGHLRVHYNTPPRQPAMSDLTMSPGFGCTYDLDDNSYVNKPPTLKAYLTDPDHGRENEWGSDGPVVSEQLQAEFKLVWGDADANTWTRSADLSERLASGSWFELDLATVAGAPDLPTNTPIGWTVRAFDGRDYSSWSWTGTPTRCRFVIDPAAPEAPTIASTDFPDDGSWTESVGEYGSFNFSSASLDVAKFRYDFTNDTAGPRYVDAAADGTAAVQFMPTVAGPYVVTVEAYDQAGNSSGQNTYTFKVSSGGPAGAWRMADPAGSSEAADSAGSNPARAGSGVTFGVKGPGANTAVDLDGTASGHLSGLVRGTADTVEGFAVAAWVRLGADRTRDQTAVSVNGIREAGFVLGYHAASDSWMFEIPDHDLRRFRPWRITGGSVSDDVDDWAHLVGVYDPGRSWMGLYVNGDLVAEGTRGTGWSAIGGVEIGRSYQAGHYTNHWSGGLAEVKLFDRVLFASEATVLATLAPRRQAYWQLNEADELGVSPEYLNGPPLTLSGDASIYTPDPDQPFAPQPLLGAGHLKLEGATGCATTAGAVLNTAESFSFTLRVKLASAAPGRSMTVLSVPGTATNLLELRYSAPDDAWQLVISHSDTVGATTTSVISPVPPSAEESGQLLAVVYDAFSNQIKFYVNGDPATVAVAEFGDTWRATGGLQLGRLVNETEHFSGAIDDVRGYAGVTDETTLQKLSLREEQPDL